MVSKVNKIVQLVRDVVMLLFSSSFMFMSYGSWNQYPVNYWLFGIATGLFVLTAINIILLLVNVKKRGYFYFNTTVQLLISFILSAGWSDIITGGIYFALNIAIVLTLREKKVENKSYSLVK